MNEDELPWIGSAEHIARIKSKADDPDDKQSHGVRDWKGRLIDIWEDADGDVGMQVGDFSIVIERASVPALSAWLLGIVRRMDLHELIPAAMAANRPAPTAYAASKIGVDVFLKAHGASRDHGGRLLGLPLFERPTTQEAMAAAKAAGHDIFFVLG